MSKWLIILTIDIDIISKVNKINVFKLVSFGFKAWHSTTEQSFSDKVSDFRLTTLPTLSCSPPAWRHTARN